MCALKYHFEICVALICVREHSVINIYCNIASETEQHLFCHAANGINFLTRMVRDIPMTNGTFRDVSFTRAPAVSVIIPSYVYFKFGS